MSTVTPNQGITIPVGTDGADNPTAFASFVAGVESRLAMRFTNLADRTARNPVPVEGQYADLAAEDRGDVYDGASYISATARGLYARRMRTSNAAAIVNNTLVSDAVLTVPLDVIGLFAFRGRIYYDASAIADFKLAFTFPTVAASGAKWGLLGRDITTNTNITAAVATASGTAIAAGGFGVGTSTFVEFDGFINTTATGNLVTQYAQNTTEATNMTVQYGSYLEVMKVG